MGIEFHSGLELDWIGLDQNRKIGLFSSAGLGPVPASFVNELTDAEYDRLMDLIMNLPEIGISRSPSGGAVSCDFFRRIGNRGLFVYDFQDIHRESIRESGVYELQAIPSAPHQLDFTGTGCHDIISKAVLLEDTVFGDGCFLDPRLRVSCLDPL